MKIDIGKRIDERIRKLQQLKQELAVADPEKLDMLMELISTNGNGNGAGGRPKRAPKREYKGGLSDAVRATCLEADGKFTVPEVVARLRETGYRFAAKDPAVAVYSALRRLKDSGEVSVAEEGGPAKPAQWVVTAGQKHMKLDT